MNFLKNFLKDNGKTIRKIYIYQFGAIVFALMMVLPTVRIDNAAVDALSCIITVLFYFYLLYLAAWERGASDRIRVDGKRIAPREHYGFKLGIAAMSPIVILCVLWFIARLMSQFFGAAVFKNINDFIAHVVMLIQAPFLQIVNHSVALIPSEDARSFVSPVLFLASAFIVAAVTWLSYYFGYHGKFMSVAYKNTKT